MKINHLLKKIIFLSFFLSLFFIYAPQNATALSIEQPLKFQPQTTIPNLWTKGTEVTLEKSDTSVIAGMIKGFYNYGIGIAGILAAIMLMAGGIIWLTSAGSSEKVSQAKNLLGGSIIGLVILFGSWIMLRTINPALVDFRIQDIVGIEPSYISDGKDGMIDSLKTLPEDTEIKVKCLARNSNQLCVDTKPPSIELDTSVCLKEKPEEWANANCTDSQIRHCCAVSKTTDKELDKFCEDKENGTPCKITVTDIYNEGICKNKNCEGGNICCQCYNNCALGLCAIKQCKNDLTPKECRAYCESTVFDWYVEYYIGGSASYTCTEGAYSQCKGKSGSW